jgi:copper homeostasis protein
MTKFAMMVTEKSLKILSTGKSGTVAERCEEVLRQVARNQMVLEMVFFLGEDEFDSGETVIHEECESFFGKALPMITVIAQKPFKSTLTAEVLYLRGDGTVEFHDDYLLIRSGKDRELITKGIRFPEKGDTACQAKAVFGRVGEILKDEGFKIDDIVRQWNYIDDITGVHDGVQNYQLFNDERSAFYAAADWENGYPAATGIGCSAGGVTVSVHAVRNAGRFSRPIDNPIQVPAHRYSGKVLEDGREKSKTTPKFERGRLLGDTVLISGTAAIKGESSSPSSDPRKQSEEAIEVIDSLVTPGNIHPGCKSFTPEALRVYIKREEQAETIINTLQRRWSDVPIHFLSADICRPELLLEIEGKGSVKRFLECCCTDAFEASEAQAGGAGRVELCEDLPCGGVTPSEDNIKQVMTAVDIPVNVLVRPRGGDFVYDEKEIQATLESIRMCRRLGVNGVVIGALRKDGSIDMETMRRLMDAAKGMKITFHRAFDECADPFTALEDIISLGCDRLLTAGHAENVNDGKDTLKALNEKAAGRIIILAGSGVRPSNISDLESLTGISEFHSSSHGPDGRTDRRVVREMVTTVVY